MKVLYLTFESIETQPILESQVLPLLTNIIDISKFEIDLITVENNFYMYDFKDIKINHIRLVKKYFPLLFLNIIYYLIRKKKEYDIIHVRSYIPMFFILLLKPFIKSKIIFDMRGVLPEEFLLRSNNLKYKIFSKVFKLFEQYFVKVSDSIITVSNNFKEYILDEHPFLDKNCINVIPTYSKNNNFKDSEYINCKLKYFDNEEIDLYVYSGSLEVWQKFDEVIKIFDHISKDNKNARLVVFTKDNKNAEQLLKKSINQNLFKVDSLNYDQLILSLPSCDYGFLIRDENIVNKVSSPIKFSDYVNANIFVLASNNIGDISNYIKKDTVGIILNNKNIDAQTLTDNLKQLKNISPKIRDKKFDLVKEIFSLSTITKSYLELYKELVK
jgi:glycosyltransferase involved in cell wall biosynthesis